MNSGAASHEELRGRFQRDGRLLAEVLNHPNIVPVVTRNMSANRPYFVMPKADGDLTDEIVNGRSKDDAWVSQVFRQILEAMAYAHDKTVIHRDLKPRNVLIYDGVAKVTDFGIGKQLETGTEGLTKTNAWFGTEPYMPPEQFKEMRALGPEADVFALGKLLIHLLTGDTPDVGVPDVSELPEQFRYFVQRCCAKKRENRFTSAREALEAFDRIVAGSSGTELPAETLERLVEAWWNTTGGSDEETAVRRKIEEHLRSTHDDESMFSRVVPRLPDDLIDQYIDESPLEFREMLAIYDEHVSGGLPFEYCDVVTDFYERIFRRTPDPKLRAMILKRLLRMGKSYNRWYVRTRTLVLLSEVVDASTVAMAADLIREERDSSEWFDYNLSNYPLPTAVREALRSAAA